MRLARRVVGVCAAIALVAAALDADAGGGGRGGGGRGGGKSGGHHSHSHHGQGSHQAVSGGSRHSHSHSHGYTGFFVASTFVIWPSAYYWPDYNPAAVPVTEYWYYCQPYAAYYPYVQECPTEWQPVLPSAPSPDDQ